MEHLPTTERLSTQRQIPDNIFSALSTMQSWENVSATTPVYSYNTTLTAICQASENSFRHIRQAIDPLASPDEVCFVDSLPKTRSGKTM
ncbi:MAG: hypothetical protein FJ012_11110 [Chloroflexi bacterium]|nr:hypothetical protein [Chloroflexota bacterium]